MYSRTRRVRKRDRASPIIRRPLWSEAIKDRDSVKRKQWCAFRTSLEPAKHPRTKAVTAAWAFARPHGDNEHSEFVVSEIMVPPSGLEPELR